MGQYEYLMRNPWFVAAGTPKATHDNTIYFNIRYTLAGGDAQLLSLLITRAITGMARGV